MADPFWNRVKDLVDAYYTERPADREAWLDRRCGDAPDVRREVESLLRADADGRLAADDHAARRLPFQDPRGGASGVDRGSGDSGDGGRRVGPYRLCEEIGVGGMAVVYRAERADGAFEQTVAVKLLQRRLDDEDARRRFRAERQVLARLDHPHIARLLDGGVTEGGRPYLVMDHVAGMPITKYAEAHRLERGERLDLLKQAAAAVQAAHEQLVVHRDLKPSNVLVSRTETGPQVQLLDFGIAKLLDDAWPGARPQTRTGRRPMTPSYAAPEQVRDGDISTRTDVYQFGALAYEVLAGQRAFDLSDRSAADAEQVLTEKVPAPPSQQTSEESGIAATKLRGDLDTILLQALRKDPGERYASIEALAADLQRHRDGQPIHARPATLGYRARKFLQRNAVATALTAALVLVVVGLATFTIHRISEERDRAQREARKAEQVSAYLTDLLQSTRPSSSGGETVTAADMLRRGERRIERLDDQPAVQARMLQLLGNAYREREQYAKAGPLLRRSLALRDSLYDGVHRSVANTLEELAHLSQQRGQLRDADSLWQDALAAHKTLFGTGSPKLWEPLNNLGVVASRRGHLAAADSFYRAALTAAQSASPPDSSKLANAMHNIAVVRQKQGHYAHAGSLYQRSLAIDRRRHDLPHPAVAVGQMSLGVVRAEQGRYAEADSLLRAALSGYRATYDAPHSQIALTLMSLASVRREQGRVEEAMARLKKALGMLRDVHASPHPYIASALHDLAVVHLKQDRVRRADSLLQRSLAMKRQTLGARHPRIAYGLVREGDVLVRQGQVEAAATHYREARSILGDAASGHRDMRLEATEGLGRALVALERYPEAEPLLRQGLQASQRVGADEVAQDIRASLATLYAAQGEAQQAARDQAGTGG